jgi:alpha-1,3-rhamnosyl/mannosyltransferase
VTALEHRRGELRERALRAAARRLPAVDQERDVERTLRRLHAGSYLTAVRVGFDVSPLVRPHPRGIVRVVRGLVEALERRARIEVVRLAPPPGAGVGRWRQSELARAVRAQGLAGIHSPLSAFALRGGGARVQTIHELPWRHGERENADLAHRLWAALGPCLADRVLTATEHAARDLRARLLPGAAKVVVCPWGVGPEFADEPPPGVVDEVVLGTYRLPESPLVLCLGAVRAKKNLAAAVEGLAELRRRGGPLAQLVVTGEETPQLRRDLGLVARLGLSRFVSTPGEIAEKDLPSLLRVASAVCVLSRSEGFGLPALEALACGTPVVVARDSAQAEVAGPFAIEVDPADPASVATGIERAIAEREELRYRTAERARKLTWDRCAERVEGVWAEIEDR